MSTKRSPSSLHDPVNHPTHYTSHPSGVECIDITESMNFCLGNAMKYIWRAGIKSECPLEDISKAIFYLNREYDRLVSIAQPTVAATVASQEHYDVEDNDY